MNFASIISLSSKVNSLKSVKFSDEILTTVLLCQESQRPYRITKSELDFYRKQSIQLPRLHPDLRHVVRLSYKLYDGFSE